MADPVVFIVKDMSCSGCARTVEKAARSVSGVEEAHVNLILGELTCTGSFDISAVAKAVTKEGYPSELKAPALALTSKEKGAIDLRRLESSITLVRMIITVLLALCSVVLPNVLSSTLTAHGAQNLEGALCLAALLINLNLIGPGLTNLIHAKSDMNSLLAVSNIAAVFAGHYFSCTMVLAAINIGRYIESLTKHLATRSLDSLKKLRPEVATIITAQSRTSIPVSSVNVGDIFEVAQNAYVPVDGVVESPSASLNESAITGEAAVVTKALGEPVYQGTINMGAPFVARCTAKSDKSTVEGIIEMVERASGTKPRLAKTADRIAGVFVPVVFAIAAATFLLWFFLGPQNAGTLSFALERMCATLMISCPCALGLATPVAVMVATSRAAKEGILIKDAEQFEKAGRIATAIFDKTGTLTSGVVEANQVTGDTLRPEAAETIGLLNSKGIRTVMLSGDSQERASNIAQSSGVGEYKYGLTPAQKLDELDHYKEAGPLLYCGDGVNDAPCLAAADISLTLRASTDVAFDAADFVLLKDDLRLILSLMSLSKATTRTIKVNLFWALIYNLIGLPLAAGAFLPLFGIALPAHYCAFAMSASSIIVVLNSVRLGRVKL